MIIPLASNGLREKDIEAAIEALKSGNLTMGKRVIEFEDKMRNYLGFDHFVMTNSGSSGNLLIIEALMRPTSGKPRLKSGDCVLVPAIAWPTTIWPLIQLGLIPVFVDIDPNTLSLDLKKAQQLIDTSKITISGIFIIHPLGLAIEPSKLEEFSEKNELVLINDVCESLGSWSENRHAGNCGLASSFSFYFSHHITTMEGGGIGTNDSKIADDLRSMRSHGWSRDRADVNEWKADISENDSKFLFISTGYNVRPTEIQAAIGNSQIEQIEFFLEKRRLIAKQVNSALVGTNLSVIGHRFLEHKEIERNHSWMHIPILVNGDNANVRKKTIVEKLNRLGIETRPVLTGNFVAQPAIQRITRNAIDPKNYEVASDISSRAFLIGSHHDLSKAQVDYVCSIFQSVENN